MEWMQVVSQFGFPALFAVLLLVTYKELVAKVLEKYERMSEKIAEVVKTNTEALKDSCTVNSRVVERLDALERLIQQERNRA